MLEASGLPVKGKRLCLIGDRGFCQTHNGAFALVGGGDPNYIFNGRMAVFEPATLACGCTVISSCRDFFARVISSDETSAEMQVSMKQIDRVAEMEKENLSQVMRHAYDRSFVITSDQTGAPLPSARYRLTLDDGKTVEGVTDEKGETQRIAAVEKQRVKVEVFV
jgi:hypothetical protein